MKLTAFRGQDIDAKVAEKLFQMLQQHINSVQQTVRDPVSAAIFLHREISLFFEKYVREVRTNWRKFGVWQGVLLLRPFLLVFEPGARRKPPP